MTTADDRDHQRFPTLNRDQIAAARRFASGPERRFAPGETVYAIGALDVATWLILDGTMDVTRRDGLSGETALVTHEAGQFSGEVNQLSGRPSIAGGRAGPHGCTALPSTPP